MCLDYIHHFQAAGHFLVGHQLRFVQKQERLDYLVGLGSAFVEESPGWLAAVELARSFLVQELQPSFW